MLLKAAEAGVRTTDLLTAGPFLGVISTFVLVLLFTLFDGVGLTLTAELLVTVDGVGLTLTAELLVTVDGVATALGLEKSDFTGSGFFLMTGFTIFGLFLFVIVEVVVAFVAAFTSN